MNWDTLFSASLYLCGILLWGIFFNWGDIPYQFHDWSEVNMPRLAGLQDGLQRNILPLHLQNGAVLRCGPGCDRFFSAIDVIASPQVLLLKWMPLGRWVLFNFWLMYTLGFFGLLALRRRFHIAPPLFILLFFITSFNGHILAHLSVGHLNWGGHFLMPWLVVLVDRFIHGDDSWNWVFQISLLLFAFLLQGSFHHFIWALIFLGFLSLVFIRRFFTVLKAMVFACLAGSFRLFPPALSFTSFDRDFHGGYPTIFSIYEALTHWVSPAEAMPFNHMGSNLGYWEFDLYIGKVGLWFLIAAGLVWTILQIRSRQFDRILVPIAALTILAYDRVYFYFRQIPIPLLAGERVTARMIALPFVFFVAYALAAVQKGIDSRGRWKWIPLAAASAAAVYQAYDSIHRLLVWRVTEAALAFPPAYTDLGERVANHPDPAYFIVLGVSAALSLSSLIVLAILARRGKISNKSGRPDGGSA